MSSLPIVAIRSSFQRALEQKVPIVVVSPTGSGKSTQLPLWLNESLPGKVMVVEPRRVACKALANFVAQQSGESVGETVGYRVRFDSKVSSKTKVEFVTPGVALRLLQGSDKATYSSVMLDEFHERHWEVDLLAMLLRADYHRNHDRQIVLTSATLAGKELAESIGGQLLEAEGRSYPVDLSFMGGVSGPTARDLDDRVVEAIQHVLHSSAEVNQGDILVFLPGKREIEASRQALLPLAQKNKLTVLPVHADLPPDVLQRTLSGIIRERKIYLATNVAETSLTLPGVTVVIDSGLARMRIHRGGRSALALVPIPLALMEQRRGRAGRVAPGHCIRLWQESFRPDTTLKPEVERIDLDDLVVQAGAAGWDGEQLAEAPWITPPPDFALEEAQARLQRIGALDGNARTTKAGQELAYWPVSALEATILLDAPEELQPVLADLVAMLQQRGSFLSHLHRLPSQQAEEVVDNRKELFADCRDEVTMELLCMRFGSVDKHGLRRRSLQQARAIASQLRKRLNLSVTRPNQDDSPLPDSEVLASWILKRAPHYGFVLRPRALKPKKPSKRGPRKERMSQPWANDHMEIMVDPFVPMVEFDDYKPPRAGVILRHAWIGGHGLKIVGKGELVLPCSYETLAEAGLGEQEWSDASLVKDKSGTHVVAALCQTFAGVDLIRDERELRGEALCQTLARLSMQSQWKPAFAATILDAAHLLKLFHDWPKLDRTWEAIEPDYHIWEDPESFLASQFQLLGVEQLEDTELLEPEDVRPPLDEWTRVDVFTLQEFVDSFPRQWEHHGAVYQCSVFPRKRLVQMEPANNSASKKQEPNARLIPRFHNFKVEFRKASRRIVLRK